MLRPHVLSQPQHRLVRYLAGPRERPDAPVPPRHDGHLPRAVPTIHRRALLLALGLALLLFGCSLGASPNKEADVAAVETIAGLLAQETITSPPPATPAPGVDGGSPVPVDTPEPVATRPVTAVATATPLPSPTAAATLTPTPDASPTSSPTPTAWSWTPSILEGNLEAAYAGNLVTDRYTIHFTPGTYPEADLDNINRMLQTGLSHLEDLFETQLTGHFDVYVAGSLFAAPDQALRGRSFSAARRIFFLHDATGNQADQQNLSAHEMTHLFAWNAFGRPVSAMLSEGAAVHAGMELIGDSAHVPIDAFCAAYQQAGVLPRVSSNLIYGGRVRDLPNYYAAGCFVGYLLETFGPEPFRRLYPTGDFSGVYGKSLSALESDWLAALEAGGAGATVDPQALVPAVEAVSTASDRLLASFSGTTAQHVAYLELDKARIALIEGRFDDVQPHLDAMAQALAP